MPQSTTYAIKPTPVVADTFIINDSESAGATKNITINTLPVSTPNQTALNSKLNKAGDTITGNFSNSATGFFQVAIGTTAQRPTTPLDGMMRFSTTTGRHEFVANSVIHNHARLGGDTFTGPVIAPSIVSDLVNTKQLRTTLQSFAPTGTTQTIDLSLGAMIFIDLAGATGNITLTLTGATVGASYLITVKQGTTARNIIFPTGTRQNLGRGATYTGVANTRDKISMDFDGTVFDISVNTNFLS